MALTTLPCRIFSLCGTILIKRESEERKKLGLIQDTASTRESIPMHWTLSSFALGENNVIIIDEE